MKRCDYRWTGRVPRRDRATHSGPDHSCARPPGHPGAHMCACSQSAELEDGDQAATPGQVPGQLRLTWEELWRP